MLDFSISNNLDKNISADKAAPKAADSLVSQPNKNSSGVTLKDSAEGVSLDKLLQTAGLENLDPKIVSTLKNYGISINLDNLKLVAAIMKNMPGKVSAGDLLGLMISRKVPSEEAALVGKYANGTVNFSSLFANLSHEALEELRASWNSGKVVEKLQSLVKLSSNSILAKEKPELAKEIVDNLRLQELFTILPEGKQDGSIYFQWPIFWNGQELPDCLEGEAFVPNDKENKDSYCLRIIVNPPSLGQTEIALSLRGKELHIHFGVDEKLKLAFRTIFEPIKQNILASADYKSVSFTISNLRLHKNIFSRETEKLESKRLSTIDFRA